MQGILNIRMSSVRAALLAVLVGGLVIPGALAQSAKQNQKSDKQTSGSQAQASADGNKAEEEESAPASREHTGGPHEGIKIHGHWVIDIRSPKGELVDHREFENSYVGQLPAILAGQASVGGWSVFLNGNILDAVTLQVTGVGNPSPLSLGASFTSLSNLTVSTVQSVVLYCDPSVSPVACSSQSKSNAVFSAATLAVPVSFVAGQVVQISVTYSFS
jgi:hypothetical protein